MLITEGLEVCLFPMEYCNITQGDKTAPSGTHYGNASDLAGQNTGQDEFFAPCSCKVVSININDGNAVWFQSLDAVLTPSGKQVIHFMCIHANDISHLKIGQTFKQGEMIYKEGTAGKATGNHVHCEFAFGPLDVSKRYGNAAKGGTTFYFLPNAKSIEDVCFMNDTVILNGKANWRTYMKNGWIKEGYQWFYYKSNVKQKAWLQDGKTWYWLDPETGVMFEDGWKFIGGSFFHFNKGGSMSSSTTVDGIKVDSSGRALNFLSYSEQGELVKLRKQIDDVKKAIQ